MIWALQCPTGTHGSFTFRRTKNIFLGHKTSFFMGTWGPKAKTTLKKPTEQLFALSCTSLSTPTFFCFKPRVVPGGLAIMMSLKAVLPLVSAFCAIGRSVKTSKTFLSERGGDTRWTPTRYKWSSGIPTVKQPQLP